MDTHMTHTLREAAAAAAAATTGPGIAAVAERLASADASVDAPVAVDVTEEAA